MESNTNAAHMKVEEDSWVIQIKESLNKLQEREEEENLKEFSVSIFNVSNELFADKPEAYTPQMISTGPYHHWRSELHDMDHYKLATACRFERKVSGMRNFQLDVVDEFKRHERKIRSCYHKFISAVYNSILRDLMMLENQLPLFLMKMLFEIKLGSKDKAEERLQELSPYRLYRLEGLMLQELSPFSFKLPDYSNLRLNERRHLLEALYFCIVPASNTEIPIPFEEEIDAPYPDDTPRVTPNLIEEETDSPHEEESTTVRQAFSLLWNILSSINVRLLRFITVFIERALKLRLSQFVMKFPFNLLFSLFRRLCTDEMRFGEESSVNIIQPSPQELDIPSVADLCFAGVKFSPTDGDLSTIKFDEKTATLYLPTVKLDTNTEVILRNVVAFEASAAPCAPIFRQYTDFMNGMIDGVEDVKLLRESRIILNHLQSDGEVANLWNGLGKCVRVTQVGYFDKVIKNLNRYYSRKWKVLLLKFMNNYVFSSWKFLSLLAAAILLIITCLQAYCPSMTAVNG